MEGVLLVNLSIFREALIVPFCSIVALQRINFLSIEPKGSNESNRRRDSNIPVYWKPDRRVFFYRKDVEELRSKGIFLVDNHQVILIGKRN